MWKRDENVRPAGARENGSPPPAPGPAAAPPPAAAMTSPRPEAEAKRQNERDIVNIGKSVVIKGELLGSEDLTIEGHVEGKIELRENVLTIGPNGKIKAEVFAKAVVVLGEVTGNVSATDKVDIRENGSVEGDIVAPKVAIAEGAHFRGSIDMQQAAKPASATARPGAAPAESGAAARPQAGAPTQPVHGQRTGG
jgi:cytoskeletal protein CcmA (bactofilin family)